MGLFDTSNAYGGGGVNAQVMSDLELAELRTLPPGADYSVLPPSKIPEKVYGTPSVFYILSHEKYEGFNISLGDRYLREAEESWGDLNHINYEREKPRHIISDYPGLDVLVEYQIGGVDKIAYTNANQITPQIINFSDSISETPLFSAIAPEGKERITLDDVPSSTIKVVNPVFEGMTVTKCGLVYDYKLSEHEAGQLLYDSLSRVVTPEVGGPTRSI